jgi:hypothetical protein
VVLDQGGIKREGADLPSRPPENFLTRLPPNFQKKEVRETRFVFSFFSTGHLLVARSDGTVTSRSSRLLK